MRSFKLSSYSFYIVVIVILATVKKGNSGRISAINAATRLVEARDDGMPSQNLETREQWINPVPFSHAGIRRKRSADVGNFPQESDKLDVAPADSGPMANQGYRNGPLVLRSSSRFPVPYCELDIDTGIICPGLRRGLHLEQFHYDVDNNRCTHFVYNGCGGNANRFSSLWECTQSCVKQ